MRHVPKRVIREHDEVDVVSLITIETSILCTRMTARNVPSMVVLAPEGDVGRPFATFSLGNSQPTSIFSARCNFSGSTPGETEKRTPMSSPGKSGLPSNYPLNCGNACFHPTSSV